MTVDEVKESVERLKLIVGDNEAAHQFEDGIYIGVLRAIAESNYDVLDRNTCEKIAAEALKARDIAFDRWYA